MSYRKSKKYFQNIKLYGVIGAAVIMAMSVTACSAAANAASNTQSTQTATATTVSADGIYSYDDMFTNRDLDVGYEESEAVHINLADDSTTLTMGDDEEETSVSGVTVDGNVITITEEGTYILSGTLTEGQVIVDADDAKVQLVLDNADITCASSAAIYVKSADKTFITLAEGSENILMNTAEYEAIDDNNIDAVIFSKDDLTLNGNGTLTINSGYGHGIVSKDDLKLTSGIYNITAASHALSGKDSVRIAGGTFNLVSGKDGIHSENADDEEKGFVYIAGGDFSIESTGDGIDASYVVQIDDGTFDITAGGGAENSTKTHNDMMGGGTGGAPDGGNGGPGGDGNASQMREALGGDSSDSSNGQTPPEKPDGAPGGNTGSTDSGDKQTPPEKPSGDTSNGGDTQQAPDATTVSTESTGQDSTTADDTTSDNAANDNTTEDTASTKGIKADGAIYVNGGTFNIDSADDSVHSNSDVTLNAGTYTLSTGDDGVHSDTALLVNGGTITISESYEGLEGLTVTINDGDIDITASDDGINAAGGNDTSTDEMWMEINGGSIHVLAGGDGLDSNGDLTINGGEVYIDGPSDNGNSAIDYGDRSSCYINGGTVVAIGSSGMAEEISDESDQQVAFVKLDSQMQAGDVTLTDSEGNVIVSYTALKAYDCVIISTKDLTEGQTYTLTTSGTETEVSL
ncbi:carbohydrate-binding domain-containing protein [Agathobacter sp.]